MPRDTLSLLRANGIGLNFRRPHTFDPCPKLQSNMMEARLLQPQACANECGLPLYA
jgi:hypothetical protein